MKLIQRTNRNFLVAALLVLPVAALLLYAGLNHFLHQEIDEQLLLDETRIVNQLKKSHQDFSVAPIIEIKKIANAENSFVKIEDVRVFDPLENENEPFRELHSVKEINGTYFDIIVRHSTIENEDILFVIGITMIVVLLLAVFSLFLFNNWSSKKLWKPFYKHLEVIRNFSLENNDLPVFPDSRIQEFNSLQKSLTELTTKIKRDYTNLKEFTENASHEIQTPLTIISMSLEEMLQEEMSEANYGKLYGILQSTQKLSKLNEKLLLLSKLENEQFQQTVEVNLTALVLSKVEEFKLLLDENDLAITADIKEDFYVKMDIILANLLITNILSNAIKHNGSENQILISSSQNELIFQNSAAEVPDLDKIFNRFHKRDSSENSVGLGLSIVKKIADSTHLSCKTTYEKGKFQIGLYRKV